MRFLQYLVSESSFEGKVEKAVAVTLGGIVAISALVLILNIVAYAVSKCIPVAPFDEAFALTKAQATALLSDKEIEGTDAQLVLDVIEQVKVFYCL